MTTGIYAVKDIVAKMIIGGLSLHKHEAAAIRWFTDGLLDGQTVLAKHPADFILIALGFLDDEEGKIYAHDQEVEILSGKAWAALQEEAPVSSLRAVK